MANLWLKFKTPDGAEKRVEVNSGKFIVGRHSSNELSIVDSRLSRQHISIERFGDVFVVSDLGSSNGTKLNDTRLSDPVALKDGDMLDLGGVRIEVELSNGLATGAGPVAADGDAPEQTQGGAAAPESAPRSSLPFALLLVLPLLGIFVVGLAVILYLVMSDGPAKAERSDGGHEFSGRSSRQENAEKDAEAGGGNSVTASSTTSPTIANSSASAPEAVSPPPPAQGEAAKVEQNAAGFLRRIAQNDPKAFLTSEQAGRVSARVNQLRSNSALPANIASARQNASQIRSLANSTNLKPQFLAIAAITKLGSARGDVAATARSMAPVLEKLRTQLGTELADDALLMIAAYDQGEAGEFMRLRNSLQDLATKFPESSRAIRSIWFLQKQGKITEAEFEHALTFLAIGTIAQKPDAFGVKAEALAL